MKSEWKLRYTDGNFVRNKIDKIKTRKSSPKERKKERKKENWTNVGEMWEDTEKMFYHIEENWKK